MGKRHEPTSSPSQIWGLLTLDAFTLLDILPSVGSSPLSLWDHTWIAAAKPGSFASDVCSISESFANSQPISTRSEDARRCHLPCSWDQQCTTIHCGKGGRGEAGISIPKGMDCHEARVKQQCTEILTLFSTQLGTR